MNPRYDPNQNMLLHDESTFDGTMSLEGIYNNVFVYHL